jgi:diguanylate cyclase (GGDEF)-like protein
LTENEALEHIVEKCVAIEKKAVDLYRKFAEDAGSEELKRFWRELSNEEIGHVDHWIQLLSLIEQGLAPEIFESLQSLKEQVDELYERIEKLEKQGLSPIDTTSAFAIACHLEFYMLNREFASLLRFMRGILEEKGVEDSYGMHLAKFFEGLERFSESSELKLLGETIYRVFLENRELQLQSHTDPLTGLFNKRGFLQAVVPLAHLARRKNYSTGVMMIDIDSFKQVNDTHGHARGDEILKVVTESIIANTRRSDIVARYGGDEFLVYLSELEGQYLIDIGEKIRRGIEEDTRKLIPVTVSVGVAHAKLGKEVQKDLQELLEKADYCLYQAKQYKNRVVIMLEKKAHIQ